MRALSSAVQSVLLVTVAIALAVVVHTFVMSSIATMVENDEYAEIASFSIVDISYYDDKRGLLVYFDFEECEGNKVRDKTGGGHDGNLLDYTGPLVDTSIDNNTPPYFTTEGAIGCGVHFDGADDYIRFTDTGIDLNDFTVFYMYRPTREDTAFTYNVSGSQLTGSVGDLWLDPSLGAEVRRALVGRDSAGYMVEFNILPPMNGYVAFSILFRLEGNGTAWRMEVWDLNNNIKVYEYNSLFSLCSADYSTYNWCESSSIFLDGEKRYAARVYWPGETNTYIQAVGVLARRGGIGSSAAGYFTRVARDLGGGHLHGLYLFGSSGSASYYPLHKEGKKWVEGFIGFGASLRYPIKRVITLYGGEGYGEANILEHGFIPPFVRVTDVIRMGGTPWRFPWGVIDEVRIYNRALTREEMRRLFYRVLLILNNTGNIPIVLDEMYFSVNGNCSSSLENAYWSEDSVIEPGKTQIVFLAPWAGGCKVEYGKNRICLYYKNWSGCGTFSVR